MQENAIIGELPLPPVLDQLYQIFLALNGVYSFLLSQHIQVCPLAVVSHARAQSSCNQRQSGI